MTVSPTGRDEGFLSRSADGIRNRESGSGAGLGTNVKK
jgi:hypothetical protein